jgi:hypothetical protein
VERAIFIAEFRTGIRSMTMRWRGELYHAVATLIRVGMQAAIRKVNTLHGLTTMRASLLMRLRNLAREVS